MKSKQCTNAMANTLLYILCSSTLMFTFKHRTLIPHSDLLDDHNCTCTLLDLKSLFATLHDKQELILSLNFNCSMMTCNLPCSVAKSDFTLMSNS